VRFVSLLTRKVYLDPTRRTKSRNYTNKQARGPGMRSSETLQPHDRWICTSAPVATDAFHCALFVARKTHALSLLRRLLATFSIAGQSTTSAQRRSVKVSLLNTFPLVNQSAATHSIVSYARTSQNAPITNMLRIIHFRRKQVYTKRVLRETHPESFRVASPIITLSGASRHAQFCVLACPTRARTSSLRCPAATWR